MNSLRTNPRHLYRALLRETTYIPIPKVREFQAEHIRSTFRRQRERYFQAKRKLRRDGVQTAVLELARMKTRQLHQGRNQLRKLQRANLGHLKALEYVFRETFGRSGKRRRVLIKTHMTLPVSPEGQRLHMDRTWTPPAKFATLLKNQARVHHLLVRELKIARVITRPTFPTVNKFGKPFPKCRERGIIKKWYAKSALTVLPPLEEKEWLELYQLTSKGVFQARPRRAQAQSASNLGECQSVPDPGAVALACAQKPLEYSTYRVRKAIGNPHKTTTRFVRRLLQRSILRLSPLQITHPEKDRVHNRWEPGMKPRTLKNVNASQAVSLFG